jgi:hypothetical protein
MNKTIFTFILGVSMVMLSACGVSHDSYNEVVQERDKAIADKNVLSEKFNSLQTKYDTLKKENEDFKAIIDPYKDLSEAELSVKTNEANLKAKKDEEALKDLEKKEADEKAAKEKKKQQTKKRKKNWDMIQVLHMSS